jgi:hypothetical protein
MLIKSVHDLIGAFGIGGGNPLFTVGTVENQHVSHHTLLHLLELGLAVVNPLFRK